MLYFMFALINTFLSPQKKSINTVMLGTMQIFFSPFTQSLMQRNTEGTFDEACMSEEIRKL